MIPISLIRYKCKHCGTDEVLWNSREGDVPFTIKCVYCGNFAVHDEDAGVITKPDYKPDNFRWIVSLPKEEYKKHLESVEFGFMKDEQHKADMMKELLDTYQEKDPFIRSPKGLTKKE